MHGTRKRCGKLNEFIRLNKGPYAFSLNVHYLVGVDDVEQGLS